MKFRMFFWGGAGLVERVSTDAHIRLVLQKDVSFVAGGFGHKEGGFGVCV